MLCSFLNFVAPPLQFVRISDVDVIVAHT